ncbi:MAG: hypothetical protein OXC95_13685 [Dehalococcoidia bacterium]|nr:hypothetical protein [Dehalococcoidia bacterium]
MAIVIETTDDFIRALRQNEEFKAAARRELLTEDLLELPGEFREFRTHAEENFVSVGEFREFRTHAEENFVSVGEFREFRTQTEQSLRTLTNSVNDLRGFALEGRMSTRLRQRVASTLGLTRPRTLWLAGHYVQPPSRAEAFDIQKDQAADGGQISDEESYRLTDTDMIMRATTADGERVYIAVEASGVIGSGDISRARQSADILKKMNGEEAIAAVYGFSIEPEQVEQAKPKDDLAAVHIFLETERF